MISIVIPAYNEEDYIGRCLNSVVGQRLDEPFEVIVVDNWSTDSTAAVARSYAAALPLRLVVEKTRLRGAARNRGFSVARGDVILSTDADSVVPPHWAAAMAETIRGEGTVAATTRNSYVDCAGLKRAVVTLYYLAFFWLFRFLFGHVWLTGNSMGVRRDAYDAVGGFDAGKDCGEDVDLAFRLRKLGRIRLARGVVVPTSARRFRRSFLGGVYSYVRANVGSFLYKEEPVPLSNLR